MTNQRKNRKTKATTAVRACLLAACALLLTVPPQAAAAPDPFRADWLYVEVTRGDITSGDVRGSLLLCDPQQGHEHAVRACGELRAVSGEVDRLPLKEAHCPLIHAPVSAAARGEWDGRSITYEATFANTCVLAARTGAVFELPR
ncbi:SSI family serine proteinase inhibitor [Streptomyces beigongshangae]|uniref:SSI family serine proteinase inhibitor n=1 Tax=Streptomyces beigongshangae TaxID=2841597 RepID=UPI001C85D179|nr:SSI family serine proteinase inhibitor [Streptomyces sp. REN17]